jgi:hypothetical protein
MGFCDYPNAGFGSGTAGDAPGDEAIRVGPFGWAGNLCQADTGGQHHCYGRN